MPLRIDEEKFEAAHEAFKRHLLTMSRGVAFTSFQHPFLVSDEIAYKWGVYDRASRLLNLDRWQSWRDRPGNIIRATRGACRASSNLLEHKYGLRNCSESALYRVTGTRQVEELESRLFDFFLGGPPTPIEFAPRFDALANHLRENRLGCRWDFLTYLAFLVCPQTHFPVRPTHFDALLDFYGVGQHISGHVSWQRYHLLLELAEMLKARLALYAPRNAIEIQSYMWVVSYLIRDGKVGEKTTPGLPDFDAELAARARKAKEQERVGLLGERFVYEEETRKLRAQGRDDLAERVRVVSLGNEGGSGFDILSFNLDGTERHIEVKTTVRSPEEDDGFWLSDTERCQAETDPSWTVYRVWSIDSSPHFADIGNIVQAGGERWEIKACNWFVQRR